MNIENAVLLITGANRGLGLAFAQVALEMGAKKIYAAARDPETIKLAGVIPVKLDVTNETDLANIAGTTPDVTMLINNAGIYRKASLLDENCLEVVKTVLNTNLLGMLSVSKAIVPLILQNGGGTIVNVLSAGSWLSGEGNLAYSISKAAALSLTNNMRSALNPQKVQVAAIHAGFIDTDMMKDFTGKKLSPHEVAYNALLAISQGAQEVLIDDMSKKAKLHAIAEIPYFEQ